VFERQYKGVPVTSGSNSFASYSGEEFFSASWIYENMGIGVCKNGIFNFNWSSPYTITEVVADDCNLISFEEATDIFESIFRVKFDESGVNRTGTVSKVTLSLRRIMEQNNIEKGLFVPVWDFYGEVDPPFTTGNGMYLYSRDDEKVQSLLTINAIDGTVIDISKGY
jgi:hypothetical protein